MLRRRSIFIRLLLSHMAITFIPVALLFAMLYQISVTNLRVEVETFNISNIYKIKENLDVRIKEYKSIAAQISLNPKLFRSNMLQSDYNAYEGIAELGKYKAGNAFVSDILIHYNGETKIFSSNGVTIADVILDYRYKLNEASRREFYDSIDNLELPLLKTFPSSEFIMYLVPLRMGGGYRYGTAIFVFRASSVERMISEGRTVFKDSTYILDSGKQVLLSVNDRAEPPQPGLLQSIGDRLQPGISTIRYAGGKYSLIAAVSEETGWYYVTVMPTRQFMEKVTAQQIFIVIIALLVFLLCAAAAFAMALRNYRPIRKLHSLVSSHLAHTIKKTDADEFENISSAVSSAIALNRSLNGQLDYHRLLLKQNVLIRLLRGEANGKEDLSALIQSSEIKLAGPRFVVLTVHGSEKDEAECALPAALLDFVSLRFSVQGKAYAVELGAKHSLVIVANVEEQEEAQQIAEQLLHFSHDNISGEVFVGVGKCYEEMGKINHSYIEACAAVEYVSSMNAGGRDARPAIMFFRDAATLSETYWQTSEDEMKLTYSLKQGDRVLACEALEQMLSDIRNRTIHRDFFHYRIVDQVIRVVNDMLPGELQESNALTEVAQTVHHVLEYASRDEFVAHMKKLVELVCDHVQGVNDQRENGLISHVLLFMQENYKDANLSLDSLSDRFGYSKYYWSRFFKERIGCHFSAYLWNLRSNEVKKQLASGDKMLKDIVQEVGYVDLTSFSRKFKNEEGITPSQYRKLYGG